MHQRNLEELLNLRSGTVSQYERGLREPGFDMLLAIADLFDTTVDYLLGRAGAPRESYALHQGRQRLGLALARATAPERTTWPAGARNDEVAAAVIPGRQLGEGLRIAQQVAPEVFSLQRLAVRFSVPAAALRLCMEGEATLPFTVQLDLARYLGLTPESIATPK